MASRFWVGGTGTWDGVDTTHWAATTGGAGGQTVPGSADTVTFDGSSGGGTVTVNTTVNITSLACGAFTGTLDFSANNNNVTISGSFNGSGSGTRTINLGNGTWTFTNTAVGTLWTMATITGLTFNANSSVLSFTGIGSTAGQYTFTGGGLTYATVQFAAQTGGATWTISGTNTFGTFTLTGQNLMVLQNNQTITTLNLNGSVSGQQMITSSSFGTSRTLSVASNAPTMTYCAFRDITCTGGASFVASNSFDLGHNSGITINSPSGGSGSSSGSTTPIRSPLSPPIGH